MSAVGVDAVRTFYRDVLGGRPVWPTRGDDCESLWFLVGSELLEARVTADGAVPAPTLLAVDEPEEIAERCWDAGFLVEVRDDASGRTVLTVVDPLGRRIDLRARVVRNVSDAHPHIELAIGTMK